MTEPTPDLMAALRASIENARAARNPPADPPHVAQEPPAAPGPHPDTPEPQRGSEGLILGRALIDRDGDLWLERDAERWVLLVSPAAARVLETAQRWVRAWKVNPFAPATIVAKVALADAVDAAESDQPDDPTPTTGAPFETNLPPGCLCYYREDLDWGDVRTAPEGGCPVHPVQGPAAVLAEMAAFCVQTTDNDLQAFTELPDCEACGGCGKQVPAGFYGVDQPDEPTPEPAGDAPEALVQLLREMRDQHLDGYAGRVQRLVEVAIDAGAELVAEGQETVDQLRAQLETERARRVPGPAGDGPGWTDCGIRHLIGMIEAHARTPEGMMPVTVNDAAELCNLRADRDRLERDLAAAGRLNGNLLAKLAEVEAERDQLRDRLDGDAWQRLEAERDAALARLAELGEQP